MNSRVMLLQRLFLFVCLLLLFTALLPARGGKEKPKIVRITGVVSLVGTGIFPELVIKNENGQWFIAQDERDKLHALQQRSATVEGEETVIEMRFASGVSAGTRRVLSNVRIISVH